MFTAQDIVPHNLFFNEFLFFFAQTDIMVINGAGYMTDPVINRTNGYKQ